MLVEVDVELGSHGRRRVDKLQGNLSVLKDLEENKAVHLIDILLCVQMYIEGVSVSVYNMQVYVKIDRLCVSFQVSRKL